MGFRNKALVENVQLAASPAAIYTAPLTPTVGNSARINGMTVCNNDSVTRTFSIYMVPFGGSASASNRLVKDKALNAGDTFSVFPIVGLSLNGGGAIYAEASAAAVLSINVSGVEIAP